MVSPIITAPFFLRCCRVAVVLLGLLRWGNMATVFVLLPLAPIGVWVGVRLARRIHQVVFYRLLYVGILRTDVKLLWDAWA